MKQRGGLFVSRLGLAIVALHCAVVAVVLVDLQRRRGGLRGWLAAELRNEEDREVERGSWAAVPSRWTRGEEGKRKNCNCLIWLLLRLHLVTTSRLFSTASLAEAVERGGKGSAS